MSAYQEFAEDIERRQRRVMRQQFWARTRYEWKRAELGWKALFTIGIFLLLAALLGAAMYRDSRATHGPRPASGHPPTSPASAVLSARAGR